ncbi:predicted protein [Pyrenophora tritici-repentis Pt-1C-BFP]|uniref:Uncharacterized protein n=1 Tax=Pyrenophora tritici-repentis (strain Pt-1C-BFP) TaxID=426418 RepID=B2W4Z5_PYRTR|nr:uncharacterized protein PTRG_04695 [Pyrenophora tritici-repentis Pt-1C-BFP]EDU47602.1 predicted protein [Pyrenophora tritici-repentis Pt-1C-BFP]
MGILSLLSEIIGNICRYVGAVVKEDQNTFVRYKNQDLQSLRLTCWYLLPQVKPSYIGPRPEFEAEVMGGDMNEDANFSETFYLLVE